MNKIIGMLSCARLGMLLTPRLNGDTDTLVAFFFLSPGVTVPGLLRCEGWGGARVQR